MPAFLLSLFIIFVTLLERRRWKGARGRRRREKMSVEGKQQNHEWKMIHHLAKHVLSRGRFSSRAFFHFLADALRPSNWGRARVFCATVFAPFHRGEEKLFRSAMAKFVYSTLIFLSPTLRAIYLHRHDARKNPVHGVTRNGLWCST